MPVCCHAPRAQQGLAQGGSGHLPASPGQPLGCKPSWPLCFSHRLILPWSRSPVALSTVPQGHCPASCDSLSVSHGRSNTATHTETESHTSSGSFGSGGQMSKTGLQGWRFQKRICFACFFRLPKAICVLLTMVPSTAFRARVASSHLSEICLHRHLSFSDLPASLPLSLFLRLLGGAGPHMWHTGSSLLCVSS